MTRIAVVLTARASWAKLEPVCRAMQQHPDVELQLIVCASALLERYGKVIDVVKAQGFPVAAEIYSVYEGSTHETAGKETGALVSELSSALHRLRPSCAVVCADRHEIAAAALAAANLHLPLVHVQGGEDSGSIDQRIRHAVTQLADVHLVSTELAKLRVYGATGSDQIYVTGCPSIDQCVGLDADPPVTTEELGGDGPLVDPERHPIVVLQHPVTNEADLSRVQLEATLAAVWAVGTIPIVFWPGQDAGAEPMAKLLREERARVHTVRNLPPRRFLKLVTQAACLVGNSSAGIRECSYLGVPVVDVGMRQHGRERAKNVRHCEHDASALALSAQVAHGRYPSSTLYGDGGAGPRCADILARMWH